MTSNLFSLRQKAQSQRFYRQQLAYAARVIAPAFVALTFASIAHAQGTIDFTGLKG